jgi:hypothetical protein
MEIPNKTVLPQAPEAEVEERYFFSGNLGASHSEVS